MTEFTGHLPSKEISNIPHSVEDLRLAITTEEQSQAVANLQAWDGLKKLGEKFKDILCRLLSRGTQHVRQNEILLN